MNSNLLARYILALTLSIASIASFAQTKSVEGKVIDETGSPIVGATIKVKGTANATSSDDAGLFTLKDLPQPAILEVSFVGYTSQEFPVQGSQATITLITNTGQDLDEVVVVGYGTARKKDLTGAMVTISEKNFNKGITTSPDQLIQGKTPGVMVINNTGQPGGSVTVRIRGNSSIRAGNNPLFVLDGVPMSGNSPLPQGRGDFASDRGNALTYLNPVDIASMDILKDASATAIYGSRGANGVILITTKKGQVGEPKISVGLSTGTSRMREYPQVLNASQFRDAVNFYTPDEIKDVDFGDDVDAFKAISRHAITQNYYADISGGTEKGKYRLSGGYMDQQGILLGSRLKKYTTNFSGNYRFLESKKLGLDFSLFATQMNNQYAQVNAMVGSQGNLISQALQWNPTRPLHDENGNLTFVSTTTRNPLASIDAFKDQGVTNTIVANISPSYRITDDLEYKLIYSAMRQIGNRKGMYRAGIINPSDEKNEEAFVSNNNETNLQLTHMLSYNKQVTEKLNVNAVAGYEYLSYDFDNNMSYGRGFDYLGLDYWDYLQYTAINTREISSYRSPTNQLQSQFVRGAFNFMDRYLLTATVRRDGSTKFGKNNKNVVFPSLAFAWNIAEESFLKENENIEQLKLRIGWGKTGNQEIPSGAALNRFVFGTGVYNQTNIKNDDLKWETSTTLNIGVDFGLWKNRLYGSVDYFHKSTTDALFEQTLAPPGPAGRIWVNLDGQIINKGVEVAVTGNIVAKENWNWDLSANATFLKNSVTGLLGYYETAALRGQGFSGVTGQRMVNDQPLNVWYLAKYEGLDPATGQSQYLGLDGSVSTTNDPAINKFYVNSPNPSTLIGISTNVTYKKLSLGVNMNGAFGHYLFNNTAATTLGISNLSARNIGSAFFDTSVKESTSNSAAPSTRYLEKGDYMKLANMTLGYRIGDIGNAFKNFNVSLTGQNLFIITKYTGFDPEVNTDGSSGGIASLGIEYLPYPPARSILLGVNFSL